MGARTSFFELLRVSGPYSQDHSRLQGCTLSAGLGPLKGRPVLEFLQQKAEAVTS